VIKRQVVEALRDTSPVQLLCQVLDLAPSTYYYQPRGTDDLSLLVAIEDVLQRFPVYGYRRVTEQLGREDWTVNHKRVYRVMRENDLLVKLRRSVTTTQSQHQYARYPNLLQGLEVTRPNQVWCADITYIRLQQQYVYLAILLDVYTRGLVGWHLGRTLSSDLAVTALTRALQTRQPEIHHSDQGVQYAATGYVTRLRNVATQISMAAKGQPTQNPFAERVIRTIKEEEVYLNEYLDFAMAHREIGHFIEDVYQTKRIHSALGYLTPEEFEAAYYVQHTA
jgi:transposase InsO family protein